MAATTVMHDELTGVTLTLRDDETTDLLTVLINGHEVLIPEDAHTELYETAFRLQGMMRAIKEAFIGKGNLAHTEAYGEFNEAVLKFTERSE